MVELDTIIASAIMTYIVETILHELHAIDKWVGASIVKWTKQVLRYTKAMVFLVKGL